MLGVDSGDLALPAVRTMTGSGESSRSCGIDASAPINAMDIQRPDYAELTAFVTNALDAIVSIDNKGRIRLFNPAAERLFQWSAKEILGQSVNRLMAPEDSEVHDSYIHRYLKSGRGRVIGKGRNVSCLRRDGTHFLAHLWLSEYSSGEQRFFTAVLHDLSERQRISDELVRTREELELTVDNAPIGIATLNLDGQLLALNQTAAQVTGYGQDELIGYEALSFMHVDDQQHIRRSFRALITERIDHSVSTHQLRTAGGDYLPVQLYIAVAHDTKSRPRLLICMFEDLTGQLTAESELQIQRERLAHIARVDTMGEMAVGLAHELNQPLSAITTYAHAARRMLHNSDGADIELLGACDKIAAQAKRASDIIEKLRALTRRQSTEREPVCLNELLANLRSLIDIDSRHTGVKIDYDLTTVPAVTADPVQIEQVILNFVRNAIDAVRNGPDERKRVLIQTRTNVDGDAELSVVDAGDGVDESARTHLFDAFFTTKPDGMGMGLSISRTLIQAHHGHIGYRPNPDDGAVFWFSLPNAQASEPND